MPTVMHSEFAFCVYHSCDQECVSACWSAGFLCMTLQCSSGTEVISIINSTVGILNNTLSIPWDCPSGCTTFAPECTQTLDSGEAWMINTTQKCDQNQNCTIEVYSGYCEDGTLQANFQFVYYVCVPPGE